MIKVIDTLCEKLDLAEKKIMKKEKLFVDNLKCGGCAATIKDGLLKLEGVEHVIVYEEKGMVEIDHDGQNEYTVFVERLSKMGYPERGTSTLAQMGKSYVSCAIGKFK